MNIPSLLPVALDAPAAVLKNVSVAAPAYNEGENIRCVVENWAAYLGKYFQPDDYEIIVCDDGSKDDSWSVLTELARQNISIKPCRHMRNQGAAAALATAIRHTTKDWVLLLDSDDQYPIANLERFIQAISNPPVAAFIGFRPRKEDSAIARFGSWASGWCCNLFHGTHYRDFNCALKLVRGSLLRDLNLEAKGLNYSTEITSKILERGVAMVEIESLHQPRRKGRSSRTLVRGSMHRFLFVFYIGFRQFLFYWGLLQRRSQSFL